jgi:hypothetical protein
LLTEHAVAHLDEKIHTDRLKDRNRGAKNPIRGRTVSLDHS